MASNIADDALHTGHVASDERYVGWLVTAHHTFDTEP